MVYSIKKLYDESKYEDALILQFMYLFRLTPSEIYLLDFECITNGRWLTFIKEDSPALKNLKINQILLNDVKFYATYRKLGGNELIYCRRFTQAGVALDGRFIFTQKPKTIYNHFNNKFGGSLPSFDFSPRTVINLSIQNYHNNEPKLHYL